MQGFARLAAVHGGTYMLNKQGAEVQYDGEGRFAGVKDAEGETARAPMVIGDPSYFPGKTRVTGKVVRAICIMNHAIPNTGDSHSVQIIVPYSQVGRKNDIYVFCSSYRRAPFLCAVLHLILLFKFVRSMTWPPRGASSRHLGRAQCASAAVAGQ